MSVEYAYRRLACAILIRAARDAENSSRYSAEARRWLVREGVVLAGQLGIPAGQIRCWVNELKPIEENQREQDSYIRNTRSC